VGAEVGTFVGIGVGVGDDVSDDAMELDVVEGTGVNFLENVQDSWCLLRLSFRRK